MRTDSLRDIVRRHPFAERIVEALSLGVGIEEDKPACTASDEDRFVGLCERFARDFPPIDGDWLVRFTAELLAIDPETFGMTPIGESSHLVPFVRDLARQVWIRAEIHANPAEAHLRGRLIAAQIEAGTPLTA